MMLVKIVVGTVLVNFSNLSTIMLTGKNRNFENLVEKYDLFS